MLGTTVATVLALAAPAAAHAEVLLDETDKDPSVAPLAIDGTDAITFFGVIEGRGDMRAFQFNMQAGQQLHLTLGIPNLAPENTYATEDLPRVCLRAPDGTILMLTPAIRVPFTNPESGMNFLFLRDYTATAITGTYSVMVMARKPARFITAIGQEGSVFEIQRGTLATHEEIEEWYATAP